MPFMPPLRMTAAQLYNLPLKRTGVPTTTVTCFPLVWLAIAATASSDLVSRSS